MATPNSYDARLSKAFDEFLRALSKRSAPTGVRLADVVAMLKSRKAEILASVVYVDPDPVGSKWFRVLRKIADEVYAGNQVLLEHDGHVRFFTEPMITKLVASKHGLGYNAWVDLVTGKRQMRLDPEAEYPPFLYAGSPHNFYVKRGDGRYYYLDDGSEVSNAPKGVSDAGKDKWRTGPRPYQYEFPFEGGP